DVAALTVGDHQQPALARVLHGGTQRCPPGRAEHLEASELELDGDARLARRVDDLAAMPQNSRSGLLDGGVARARLLLCGRPQRLWIGIEAEHDLRLALGHARGEGVAEAPLQAQLPLTALFKALPAVK